MSDVVKCVPPVAPVGVLIGRGGFSQSAVIALWEKYYTQLACYNDFVVGQQVCGIAGGSRMQACLVGSDVEESGVRRSVFGSNVGFRDAGLGDQVPLGARLSCLDDAGSVGVCNEWARSAPRCGSCVKKDDLVCDDSCGAGVQGDGHCERIGDAGVVVGTNDVSATASGEGGLLTGSPVVGEGSLRGPNWARNKRNREQQKARKFKMPSGARLSDTHGAGENGVGKPSQWSQSKRTCDFVKNNEKRAALASDWRSSRQRSAVTSLYDGERVGFFSQCDEKTQKALRESRAAKYIAENNRRAAQENEKMVRMTSPEAVVTELVRVSKMVSQLESQTKNTAIGGWAKTVGESLTKSVAQSAPSSFPSLEEVGYGETALEVKEKTESKRKACYDVALRGVAEKYSKMMSYNESDEVEDVRRVKEEYSDVAYTERENIERDIIEKMTVAMGNSGMGIGRIEMVFEDAGIKTGHTVWF